MSAASVVDLSAIGDAPLPSPIVRQGSQQLDLLDEPEPELVIIMRTLLCLLVNMENMWNLPLFSA
jgi:hypothetical protein